MGRKTKSLAEKERDAAERAFQRLLNVYRQAGCHVHESWSICWPDGRKYEGELRHDKFHGQGTYTWPHGDKHEGQWLDGKMHGQGTYTWHDGRKYEGEWRDDKRHGNGILFYSSGNKYEGGWHNDKRYGQGTFTSADGAKYQGEWGDDKKNGHGTDTFADGKRYEGAYLSGKMHGWGTFTWPDSAKYEGQFENDKKHGHGTCTCPGGQKYEGTHEGEYFNGVKHRKGMADERGGGVSHTLEDLHHVVDDVGGGRRAPSVCGKKVQGANAPQLSSLLQHGDLLQQISAHLCHADIARLCMSCTLVSFWTNTLYKTVCDGLGFKQTGSRSRPLPYSLIFRQHLCTECCRPAVSDNSVHIDLNGGCRSATRWPANEAVKWLCGECRRELKASHDKSSSLQHTARRFGDAVRREMLEILR